MTVTTAAARAVRLATRERVAGALLASASGAAILGYAFFGIPLSFSATFGVIPATLLLAGAIFAGRGQFRRLRAFADVAVTGATWGLAATIAYDVVRPLLRAAIGFQYHPFGAMPVFGSLITLLPQTHPAAITAGWIYHFWNGVTFAVAFAMLRPRGGVPPALAWALGLQIIMMTVYPHMLRVRLDDPGFLASSIVGHTTWGLVLGWGLARESRR